MSTLFMTLVLLTYLSGAIPWSVWLSRVLHLGDVRTVADGNPGAANAFRVGGWRLGVAVVLLDFFKAFLPVFIARWGLQLPDGQLLWVALLPTVGHAFSIFLGFRGGRALVTLFGVWAGLTLYELPLVMGGAAIAASVAVKNDVYRALVIPVVVIVALVVRGAPGWMLVLGAAQLLILAAKISVFYRNSHMRRAPAEQPSRLKT